MNSGTDDRTRRESPGSNDKAVESLLRLASSRPEPSEGDREAIQSAVKDEWQTVTARRRSRRHVGAFSIAASALLVMTIVFLGSNEPTTHTDLRKMATVERISGRVEVLGTQTQEHSGTLRQQMPVYVGQTLKTASGSGMALTLESGISLRVDEFTEIELISENSLKLDDGRIYVDTQAGRPGTEQTDAARFEILTDKGAVRHLGTQYMVLMGDDALSVSVREGNVQVIAEEADGPAVLFVKNGMQMLVDDAGASASAPTEIFGTQWQWAEHLGAGFVLDSRTIAEFLEWVARETGYEIEYESEAARSIAVESVLHGTVDLPAREALDLVLETTDLSANMVDGTIKVRLKN